MRHVRRLIHQKKRKKKKKESHNTKPTNQAILSTLHWDRGLESSSENESEDEDNDGQSDAEYGEHDEERQDEGME